MKVAIVGYGKMGRMIHSLLSEGEVVSIIDPFSNDKHITSHNVDTASLKNADVVIDFSSMEAVRKHIMIYAENALPAVIGTTGWYDELEEIAKETEGMRRKFIYSGNFSISVYLFLAIIKSAGKMLDVLPEYDIAILESHHRNKADAPSGTALMAAGEILKTVGRKKKISAMPLDGKISPEELCVSSIRVGSQTGMHTLFIDNDDAEITITHTARSRSGFAKGAILAARWIQMQEDGIYTMDDFAAGMFGGNQNA